MANLYRKTRYRYPTQFLLLRRRRRVMSKAPTSTTISGALEAITVTTLAAAVSGVPQSSIASPTYVTLGTIAGSGILETVPPLQSGWVVAYGNVVGIGGVVVNTDGTFEADFFVVSFDFQVWDGSSWSNVATQYMASGFELEAINVTTFAATVTASVDIQGALEAITVTTYPAQISSGQTISGALEAISVVTFGATITATQSPGQGRRIGKSIQRVLQPVLIQPLQRVLQS